VDNLDNLGEVDGFSIKFYRTSVAGPAPVRADPSVGGTLPARALRYCEPARAASAFGWYAFPPCSIGLRWDGGHLVEYRTPDLDGWEPLVGPVCDPDDRPEVDPRPALLTPLDSGAIQVGLGLIVETAENWSLLVRPVANYQRETGYELREGIVETDRWAGPLFVNLQLRRPIVVLSPNRPLAQLQPVHRTAYSDGLLGRCEVVGEPGPGVLARYRETVRSRPLGTYATVARRRRADEERAVVNGGDAHVRGPDRDEG
jgi:hypothetical protein